MLRPLFLCAIVLALFPAYAAAEWHFTPLVGYTFKGGTNIIDSERERETGEGAVGKTHKHFGGAVSIFGEGILGIEAVALWTPSLFQGKSDEIIAETVDQDQSLSLMGNVVLGVPIADFEHLLRPLPPARNVLCIQSDGWRALPHRARTFPCVVRGIFAHTRGDRR